jgi:multiple sugar transport system substrate-binding protein
MRSFKLGLVILVILLLPGVLFATGQKEAAKAKVTFFWALYDGLTDDYRVSLQDAFMKANPDIQMDIVPVAWDQMETKVTTSIAGGNPPELSVIGTRWLLEYMSTNSVVQVTDYVSKATIDNIAPGAQEAKIGGKLMGLPIAAGARIMAINNNITKKVPMTMEELRQDAIAANNPPKNYGLIMPGKIHTELTDFCYYLYAAGGDYFEKKADGSYGKSVFNGPAGVKALEFMVQLANKDKVVPEGYLSLTRMDSHPLFYEGKAAYVFIGAWVESAMKSAGSTFPVTYGQIPPFQGNKQESLIITDSVAMFRQAKNLAAAGKFLDFFYQDQWKAKFDELVGFPPVTISASKLPQFQSPLYQALGQAALGAKGWPLIEGWAEFSNIIWDANVKAFLGQMSPKAALDEAAAKIDKSRGM